MAKVEGPFEAQKVDHGCQTFVHRPGCTITEGVISIGSRHRWRPSLPTKLACEVAKSFYESVLGAYLVLSRKCVLSGATVPKDCASCLSALYAKEAAQTKAGLDGEQAAKTTLGYGCDGLL